MKAKWKLKKTVAIPLAPKHRFKPKRIVLVDGLVPWKKAGVDPVHLTWIREQPCALRRYPIPGATRCRGKVEAHHHTGGRGRGQISPDRKAFPLCARHHRPEFHDATGTFATWKKAQRRAWQDEMVEKYREGSP
jgi:hypothetical protein